MLTCGFKHWCNISAGLGWANWNVTPSVRCIRIAELHIEAFFFSLTNAEINEFRQKFGFRRVRFKHWCNISAGQTEVPPGQSVMLRSRQKLFFSIQKCRNQWTIPSKSLVSTCKIQKVCAPKTILENKRCISASAELYRHINWSCMECVRRKNLRGPKTGQPIITSQ